MPLNFNEQNSIDPSSFAAAFQRKAEIEAAQEMERQRRKQQVFKDITEAIIQGQTIASNMMSLAENRNKLKQQRSQQEGLDRVTNLIGPEPYGPQESPENRKQRFLAALAQSNPKDFTEYASKAVFAKPENTESPSLQAKTIKFNGQPTEALLDPKSGTYYDASTKKPLNGKIEPYSESSADRAHQIEENRIQRVSENMGKDLNELSISANSPAGISAKRALYSKSGLKLIQQAENQPGGADKRQVAELQMEVARVLTGAGIITNEQINNLATNTARKRVADWQEWLTNKPTGAAQQAFISRFKETLERQLNFHQGELERNKQNTMAKYVNFKKRYPEEFSAVLEQAGYDPKAFNETKKLVPLHDVIPPEFQSLIQSSNPEIDAVAKTLGLKKKGK